MSSQDVPAIIAASVSGLPLIGTVVTQVIGFRSTSADTKRQIQATRQNTADTLEQQRVENEETRDQQRDQLDTTLQAGASGCTQLDAQSEQLKQTLEEQPPGRFRGLQCRSLTRSCPCQLARPYELGSRNRQ
jgi:hypothetical protein